MSSHAPVASNPRKRPRLATPSRSPKKQRLMKDFENRAKEIFEGNIRGYDQVHFLGLHWEKEDLPFKNEVLELEECFKTDFQFSTKIFSIPTQGCTRKLNTEIADFVNNFSSPKGLLIVYYGGHGSNTRDGRATWIPDSHADAESTMINWYQTQPLLFGSEGDVLLIIDACYAAEAGRGSVGNKKIELLAAAGMNCRSPEPGPMSYTTKLIKTMKELLRSKGSFSVTTLNRHLEHRDAGLQQTPHYSDLTANDRASIILRPLLSQASTSPDFNANVSEPPAFLNVSFGLSEEPNERSISDCINWFRHYAPKGFVSFRLLDLYEGDDKGPVNDDGSSSQGTISVGTTRQVQEENSGYLDELVKSVLQRWRHHVKLKSSANTPTHLRPQVQQEKDPKLQSRMEGIISLRDLVTSAIELDQDGLPLLVTDRVQFDSTTGGQGILGSRTWCNSFNSLSRSTQGHRLVRFRYGTLDEQRIIVEYKYYQTDIEEAERRVCKEAMVLGAPRKGIELCIPLCVGYIRDPEHNRFGLVYKIPSGTSSHTTLSDEISAKTHVPMQYRLELARRIARTAWHLQLIDWYHGCIRSENVLFFNNNHSQPYLFGVGIFWSPHFPSGSEEAMNTCLSAVVKYGTMCDIRSLGTLLHAIGLWKLEEVLATSRKHTVLTTPEPSDILDHQLTENSVKKLEHSMGNHYQLATKACLSKIPTLAHDQDSAASVLFEDVDQLLHNAL